MIFISKISFTIKINGKRRRTSTSYELHTYIQTDRQTDRQTYIHNFYHPLDNDRNTVERSSFSNFYSTFNSCGVKNRFCDSRNIGITMKASLGFTVIFAVNVTYTAFRTKTYLFKINICSVIIGNGL